MSWPIRVGRHVAALGMIKSAVAETEAAELQIEQDLLASTGAMSIEGAQRRAVESQIRIKLAAARQQRAIQEQSRLRLHSSLVGRLIAAEKTATQARAAQTHLQANGHACAGGVGAVTTEADLLLAEERAWYAESVVASCKVQIENAVADPEGDASRSPRPSMINLARMLADGTPVLPAHAATEGRVAEAAMQQIAEGEQLEIDNDEPFADRTGTVVDISFYRAVLELGNATMSSTTSPLPPSQGTSSMSGLGLARTRAEPGRPARYIALALSWADSACVHTVLRFVAHSLLFCLKCVACMPFPCSLQY